MGDKDLRSQLEGLFSDLEEPIRAEKGQPAFLEDAVEDVTERKRAEERVRRSQKTLQTLLDSMPFGVVIIGKDKKIRRANNAALASMGYESEEQIVGMACHRTLCPAEAGKCPILDLGQELDRSERILVTKDRRHIPILKSVVPITLDWEDVLLEAFVDVTERKRAEEEFERSLSLLHATIESTADGILVIDNSGKTELFNQQFVQMWRVPQNILDTRDDEQMLAYALDQLKDPHQFLDKVQELYSQPEAESFDVLEFKDGRIFERYSTPQLLEGELVGRVWSFRDVTERKQMEQQFRESLERRGRQVQTSTEVAQEIAAAPALEELYRRVVTLVKERFGYYHAQIFRHDPELDAMVVVEGYGQVGEKMKAAGHNLPYGVGVVGTAAATGEPVLASDVSQDPHWVPHPDLPDTEGELAVPIKLRDEVLGVLDVQSDLAGALTEEDQIVLLGLAGQIASAIQSTSLFEQTQAALAEMEATQRLYVSEQWAEFVPARAAPLYERTRPDVTPLGDVVLPEVEQAMARREMVVQSSTDDGAGQAALVVPLSLRGEVIGALGLHEEGGRQWTDDEIALIEAVANQMALAIENARLFEQTQSRAARERLIREITDRIRGAVDVESILQTTVQEVGRALRTSHGLVRLGTEIELGDFSNESTNRE